MVSISNGCIGMPGGYSDDSDDEERFDDYEFYGLTDEISSFQSGFGFLTEQSPTEAVIDLTPSGRQSTWLTKVNTSAPESVLINDRSSHTEGLKKINFLDDFRVAIKSGNISNMKKFIEEGTSVNTVFLCGLTPVEVAAAYAQPAALKLLLENGAQLPTQKPGLFPVLCAACSVNKALDLKSEDVAECVRLLLEAGALADSMDSRGVTALAHAVTSGRYTAARILLEAGADVCHVDNKGYSVLMRAVEVGRGDLVYELIRRGADISHTGPDGMTAALLASQHNKIHIQHLLNNSTAIRDSTSVDELDPLHTRYSLNDVITSSVDSDQDIISSLPQEFSSSSGSLDELALLLSALNLRDLIPLFREHNIKLGQLLRFTDNDLMKLGVDDLLVRKRLLDSLRDVHRLVWETGSLPSITHDKKITCVDVLALISTIEKQIQIISSTIGYVTDQLQADPNIINTNTTTKSSISGEADNTAGNFSSSVAGNTEGQECSGSGSTEGSGSTGSALLADVEESIGNVANLYREVTRLKSRLNTICRQFIEHKPDLITHQMSLKYSSRFYVTPSRLLTGLSAIAVASLVICRYTR